MLPFVRQRYATNVAALNPVAVGGGTWVTTFSATLDSDNTGWAGYNLRQVINASLLSQSGSKVRLTLEAAAGGGLSIDSIYLGHAAGAGDVYDFDGGQVQVTVASSGSVTLGAGASVLTDHITFAFDETKNFVVTAHFTGSGDLRGIAAFANASYHYNFAASEAATTNVGGYSGTSNRIVLVNKIEVLQP